MAFHIVSLIFVAAFSYPFFSFFVPIFAQDPKLCQPNLIFSDNNLGASEKKEKADSLTIKLRGTS